MSIENKTIEVTLRNEFGNNASRRLRRQGQVPAIIYGVGKEPRAISVSSDEWTAFSGQHSGATIITLKNGDTETPVLVREVQYNHLKNYFVHIDFQEVDLNAEISTSVAIHPVGESYGAAHGGVMEQELHELPIVCRPADLPELIKVDVTALEIGAQLTVGQIVLPAGVKADIDPETVVFNVVRPKEEAEPAEGEAAEGAAEPEAINEKKTEARAAKKEAK